MNRPTERYVLDTSALLAFYQDEPGSEMVEDILRKAEAGAARIYLSSISIYEVAYLTMASGTEEEARNLIINLRALPVEEVSLDEELLWGAASLKARGGLSVADSIVAALAARESAVLVHRDPELARLRSNIATLELPKSTSG